MVAGYLIILFGFVAEPTVVPPVLLDLCTVAILHRFSSPSWWEHVAHHVSADVSAEEAFDKVVGLQVCTRVSTLLDFSLTFAACRQARLSC